MLEASNLPVIPIKSLSAASKETETFEADLEPQTKEDEAINGTNPETPFISNGWRYPFVLLLDQIVRILLLPNVWLTLSLVLILSQLDPGNLGAILRSAYYFGVDAVAVTANGR